MKIKIKTPTDMPHAEDAERALLCCLLSNPKPLIPHAKENVRPEAFYHPSNRLIFTELVEFGMKHEVDVITFSQHLKDRGLIAEAGGDAFLSELLTFTPTPSHYQYYASIIDAKLRSRNAIGSAQKVIQAIQSGQDAFDELAEPVLNELAAIRAEIQGREQERSWDDEMDEWRINWEQMASGRKESSMPTKWNCWNREIGGVRPGYTIISGTSSSGKSTLLTNLMRHACIDGGRPGALFSYEMPVRMVISRLIAEIADVDGMHVFAPDKTEPDSSITRRIADASGIIGRSPLRVFHIPKLSSEGACSIARKMFAEHGDIIVGVDYIQIIKPPSGLPKDYTREREVAANSEAFRILSKELDRPVIALSQLNKDGTTRESTSLVMDCDDHFKVDRPKDEKTGKVIDRGIWVGKNRNGRSDFYLNLKLNGPRFRFEEPNTEMP